MLLHREAGEGDQPWAGGGGVQRGRDQFLTRNKTGRIISLPVESQRTLDCHPLMPADSVIAWVTFRWKIR